MEMILILIAMMKSIKGKKMLYLNMLKNDMITIINKGYKDNFGNELRWK
jgi:hypothetical protein